MFDSEPGRFRAWRARRRLKKQNSQLGLWITSIFVIVVLGGGILVVLLPRDWFSSPPENPPSPVVQLPMPGPSPEIMTVCQKQEPQDIAPSSQAPTTSWVLVGKTAAPQAEDVGPLINGFFRQCYARTPDGALFSAANYFAVLVNCTPAQRVDLIKTRMSRDGDFTGRVAIAEQVAASDPNGELPKQNIVGYRWVSYTPDEATIQLVIQTPETTMYSINYTMLWQGNDWLLKPFPLSGPTSAPVASLTNYIPWSGTT